MLAQYATWRAKRTPAKSWRNAWKRNAWTKRLFGRIYESSTASRGAASWIASLEASRVNPTRSLAARRAKRTIEICGRMLLESYGKSSPHLSSSRMSPISFAQCIGKSEKTYSEWATWLNKESLARRKWARLIYVRGFSSWGTPRVTTNSGIGKVGREAKSRLEDQAANWPTPRAEDAESCGNHPGATDSLTGATRHWPTPDASMATGGRTYKEGTVSPTGKDLRTGKKRSIPLNDAAKKWPPPRTTDQDSTRAESGKASEKTGEEAWLTPSVEDAGRKGSAEAYQEYLKDHRTTQARLRNQAINWATPNAHDATGGRGEGFEKTDHHYRPHDLVNQVKQWPTPKTPTGGSESTEKKQKRGNKGGEDLEASAKKWRTPDAPTSRGGPGDPEKRKAAGHTVNLEDQASHWPTPRVCEGKRSSGMNRTEFYRLWATPAYRDYRSTEASQDTHNKNSRPLSEQVGKWVSTQHTSSPQGQTPKKTGKKSSSTSRRLNPLFVSWLMNWPLGWSNLSLRIEPSNFACWETASSLRVLDLLLEYFLTGSCPPAPKRKKAKKKRTKRKARDEEPPEMGFELKELR